ncbi:unnamed protein product [Cylindrotheca closterium]|uniref:Conserved oligomeric Golgi complex subunit 8 n=1 Tax=Cylindrotheca closterium TaxID=2856 RepID=A0AAD2GDB3_9STRA|nr:unnamed protein product [Cylindrotheca closterium]
MAELLLPGKDVDERLAAKAALESSEEKLRSLCASYAGTFVSVERRGHGLEQKLRKLLESAKSIESRVSTCEHSLEQEDESDGSLAALSEKHRVRRRTLLQHSTLLELLELPSLMDACVRSNLYEEALSIAAFANTLERRHAEKNDVVLKVISQVRSRQSDLRRHLLFCLKSYVSMPQCLEIVTALRRLNSIDLERQSESNLERVHGAMELSLQVDFLEARDVWLDQPSTNGESRPGSVGEDASIRAGSEQLLDSIERYRTRMFEIATQFNAIFRAQANSSAIAASLLNMWAVRRVRSFLATLEDQLCVIDNSASLRDALDSCVFFSTSMGRLGADFTSSLAPLFESKMHSLVVASWTDGVHQFADTLKICRDAVVAAPLVSSTVADAVSSEYIADGSTLPPPRQLMALPPLGRLVNAFLSGLNELRRCLLPGIFPKLRKSLQAALVDIDAILQANERAVLTPGLRGDASELRHIAREMKTTMKGIVTPYLQGALEHALGNKEGARRHNDMVAATMTEPVGGEIIDKKPEKDTEDDTETYSTEVKKSLPYQSKLMENESEKERTEE